MRGGVFTPSADFHDAICLCSSAIQSEHHSGCIGGHNGDAIFAVPSERQSCLRTRSMGHLLSSVDPVQCCDTVTV
jgi:hypothetical protein